VVFLEMYFSRIQSSLYYLFINGIYCRFQHLFLLPDLFMKESPDNYSHFSFMTYHRVCNRSNTTSTTDESGTDYSSGACEFTPDCNGVRVARSFVL